MTSYVTVTRDGNLARLQIDDGKGNVMGTPMLRALITASREAAAADAVLITGRPKVFCGGLDLGEVIPKTPDQLLEFLDVFHDATRAVFAIPRPVITAARGSAVAGGAILLAQGDVRVTTRDS